MDNQAASRVKELLAKNDKVSILVGKNPSLDQMAAALSLYLGLKQLGKTPAIASPTESIVANSSLIGIDKVKTELSGEGGDLIVSFPYREGEIEKVSYTLENGYLNIVVKATEEGLSFDQQNVVFKRSKGAVTGICFIVGTPRLSDLGGLFDPEKLKDTVLINVDNQNDNQGFGDVVLVTPQASSLSELMGNILQSLQVEIDQDIAQNLLSGITDATNNFQNSNTTYMAFAMVSEFLKKGARRIQQVEQKSTDSKSPFGPFVMPQPRVVSERPGRDVQRNDHQGTEQTSFRQQPGSQRQRSWEQRPQQNVQQPRVTQQPVQHVAPMQQPQAPQQQPVQHVERKEDKEDPETPPDWLAPKVYKSSTLI